MTVHTHVEETDSAIAALREDWARFRSQLARPHIRQLPEWLAIQARTGGGSGDPRSVARGSGQRVVAASSGGALVGLAPLLVHHWRWRCRLGYVSVADFSVRRAVVCGDALLAPEDDAIHEALLMGAAPREGDGVVFIECLPVGSFLWQLLHRSRALADDFWIDAQVATPHRMIELDGRFDDYLKKFSARTRQTLRYKVRKLEKAAGGRLAVERAARIEDLDRFLEQAERISERSWQGTRLGQIIRASTQRPRLAAYCDRGWLRAYLMRTGDAPIAFVIGTQADGVYYYEHPAYDPAWTQYNPGTVLLYRIIEDLCAEDRPRLFDFGYGDNEYKRLFANVTEEAANVLLVPKNAALAVPYGLHVACRATSGAARSALDRFELRDRVRHLLRGRAETARSSAPSADAAR